MKRLFLMLSAFVCLMSFAGNALACACCTEPGFYMNWTGKPDASTVGMLDEMKFAPKAWLQMSDAGFMIIEGLSEVEKEFETPSSGTESFDFDLVNAFTNKRWKFTLKTPGGKSGTLALPMPTRMDLYKADILEKEDTGLGVTLYKEMRFKGFVQNGTGIFRSSIIKPTTYLLVFQGRGNACDDVSNFTDWLLQIDGKKAKYEFKGKLTTTAPQQ
jgi:hypothetical protein